jgi:Antirestriction protein (ArdA)
MIMNGLVYGLGEYEGIDTAHEIACFIETHGEIAGELLNHFGGDLDDARKAVEESYSGSHNSLADYAPYASSRYKLSGSAYILEPLGSNLPF